MKCLAAGDWQESLRFNPLAVPMTVLFALTLCWLVAQIALRKRLSLPGWIVIAWAVILPVAWIIKLTGDHASAVEPYILDLVPKLWTLR